MRILNGIAHSQAAFAENHSGFIYTKGTLMSPCLSSSEKALVFLRDRSLNYKIGDRIKVGSRSLVDF